MVVLVNFKLPIFDPMLYPNKYPLLLIYFLIIHVAVFSQEEKTVDNQRLKIGLVLSGGGAKGIAHIGI